MFKAIRKFIRQFPLAIVGIVTLAGTGVTTVLILAMNPPVHDGVQTLARSERLIAPVIKQDRVEDERATP